MRIPELAHRCVRIFPILKEVAVDYVSERRLVVARQALSVRKFRHAPVVVLRHEIADRPPPARQERLRLRRRADDPAEERGQVRPERLAVGRAIVVLHLRRPRLAPAFPAVDHHAVQAARERPVRQLADISGEVRLDAGGVKLVAFPASRLLRRGGVHVLRVHMAETQNHPPSRRCSPLRLVRDVDDPCRIDPGRARLLRRLLEHERAERAPSLGLPVGQPRRRAEGRLKRPFKREFVLDAIPPRVARRLVTGKRDVLHIVAPVRCRYRRRQYGLPSVRRFRLKAYAPPWRVVSIGRIPLVETRQGHRPDRDRLREPVDDLVSSPLFRDWLQIPSLVALRRRERQHADIAPVGVPVGMLFRHGRQCRQFFSPIHVTTHEDQITHRSFRRDPRPAGLRPSGAILQNKLKPKPLAFVTDVPHHLFPFRTCARHRLAATGMHPAVWTKYVEEMHTGHPRRLYRLQVFRQAVQANVPAHQLQPRLRPRRQGVHRPNRAKSRQPHQTEADSPPHAFLHHPFHP